MSVCPKRRRASGKINQKEEDEAERHAPIEAIGLSIVPCVAHWEPTSLLEGKVQWCKWTSAASPEQLQLAARMAAARPGAARRSEGLGCRQSRRRDGRAPRVGALGRAASRACASAAAAAGSG